MKSISEENDDIYAAYEKRLRDRFTQADEEFDLASRKTFKKFIILVSLMLIVFPMLFLLLIWAIF